MKSVFKADFVLNPVSWPVHLHFALLHHSITPQLPASTLSIKWVCFPLHLPKRIKQVLLLKPTTCNYRDKIILQIKYFPVHVMYHPSSLLKSCVEVIYDYSTWLKKNAVHTCRGPMQRGDKGQNREETSWKVTISSDWEESKRRTKLQKGN